MCLLRAGILCCEPPLYHSLGTLSIGAGCSVRARRVCSVQGAWCRVQSVWCVVCTLHPAACDATMGCTRQPHPRKDSGSARNQHRPHCIRARAPSRQATRQKAVWKHRAQRQYGVRGSGEVHRPQGRRTGCSACRQKQKRKCSRALALRSRCRMRSTIYVYRCAVPTRQSACGGFRQAACSAQAVASGCLISLLRLRYVGWLRRPAPTRWLASGVVCKNRAKQCGVTKKIFGWRGNCVVCETRESAYN